MGNAIGLLLATIWIINFYGQIHLAVTMQMLITTYNYLSTFQEMFFSNHLIIIIINKKNDIFDHKQILITYLIHIYRPP